MAHWETKTISLPCYDYSISESASTSNINNLKTHADSTTYAGIDITRGWGGADTQINLFFDFTSILGVIPTSQLKITKVTMITNCYIGNESNTSTRTVKFIYNGVTQQTNTFTKKAATYTWSGANLANTNFQDRTAMYIQIYGQRSTVGGLTTQRSIYIAGATLNVEYQVLQPDPPPVITITSQSSRKIGKNSECITKFKSDLALSQWEARAILSTEVNNDYKHGVGVLVEEGSSLAANTEATVSVLTSELTDGDGNYIIYIAGQSTLGEWSDEE